MSTLAQLKARIADEVNRTNLSSQIADAVLEAIYDCQSRRFRFNQVRDTFSTVAGQEFYSDTEYPDDIIEIDAIRATVNGRDYPLDALTYTELERINSTSNTQGIPRYWAWYADQIRLYPVPDGAYTLTVSYHQRIDPPAEDASNVWTDPQYAGQLVRAMAKRKVYAEYLKDPDGALAAAESEVIQTRRLARERNQVNTGGLVGSM